MYIGSIIDYSLITAILGLYIGQVAFRYFGAGRLTAESYSGKGTFFYQLMFAAINVGLYVLPHHMKNILILDKVSLWAQAVFILEIPYLVLGFITHYSLPMICSRIIFLNW